MAHPTQRARQRSKAIDDLRESCARLAERFGVESPEIPERFTKDPSHLPTLQLEAVTKFLDTIVDNDGSANPPAERLTFTESFQVEPDPADTFVIDPKTRTPSPKPGRAAIRA